MCICVVNDMLLNNMRNNQPKKVVVCLKLLYHSNPEY